MTAQAEIEEFCQVLAAILKRILAEENAAKVFDELAEAA